MFQGLVIEMAMLTLGQMIPAQELPARLLAPTELTSPAALSPSRSPQARPQPSSPVPPASWEPPTTLNPATPEHSLQELESMALTRNPTLAAAEGLIIQQQGLLIQMTRYPNPTVGYLRNDPDQSGQNRSQGVFLSQELVTPGKIKLARESGTFDVQWRMFQLEAQKTRIVNDIRVRYYEALGAQEAVTKTEELNRIAQAGVQLTRDQAKAGLVARPDILQAEIFQKTVQGALRDAQSRYQSAWRQLTNVVGVPELALGHLQGSLEQGIPQLDWDAVLTQLLTQNPVVQAQEALVDASQADLRLSRLNAVPNLTVQVVAQRDPVQKFSNVSTLLALPLPLFNRNQGNIRNAQGVVQQQAKELERVKLALRDQLAATFQQYLSNRNQAENLRQEILPRAKENLDLTRQAYKAGQYDFLRVLTAQQTYFQTQLSYLEALTALHKNNVEITGLLMTGGLNPTEVGTALQSQGGAGTRNILFQQMQQQSSGANRILPGAIQGSGP